MSNVGTVVFDVAAETAKLRSELDKVRKDVGGLSASAKNFEKGLKVVGGVIATVFSVGAISSFVRTFNQAGDRLNDVSQKLGVSASRLNVLELAATQAGASTEAVSTAMAKLTENVGSAAMGNKAAAAAISTLGLSTEQLLKLRPDETFEAVTQALSRMPNEFQRAAIAQDLLGKGAKELSAFYREGETAIAAAQAALEKHNAVLSDLDVARIGVMNDDLDAQGTILTNLGIKWLSNFSPAVEVAVGAFSNLLQTVGGTTEAGRTMGIVFVGVVKAIETAANLIMVAFESVRAIVAGVIGVVLTGLEKLVGGFAWVAEKLGLDIAENLRGVAAGISGIAESMFTISGSAVTNAISAGKGVRQAAADILNSATIFDEASRKLEARAQAAAARAPGGGEIRPAAEGAVFKPMDTVRIGEGISDRVRVEGPSEFQFETMLQGMYDRMHEMTIRAGIGRVEAWRSSLEQMTGLTQLAADQQLAIEQAKAGNMGAIAFGIVGAALDASGKLGKVQKAFAIAGTIWTTGHAIMKAMSEVPWPANLAAAASIAAMGAREIQKIRGTNFSTAGTVSGGGFSGGGLGGGGTGAGAAFSTPPAVTQQEPQRMAQVIIQGDVFASAETVNYLIEKISEAINDRDVSFIDVNSRQALELGAGA